MMLEEDFIYFIDNQDYLANKYNGRYIVIKNQVILGDFPTRDKAVNHAVGVLGLEQGTFLVQVCVP
jgi:hypothetical protein